MCAGISRFWRKALWMLIASSAQAIPLSAADIYLKNEGSLQIWWAVLEESSGLLGSRWAMEGWNSAAPGEERRLYHSPHEELIHIVFGLRTPDGSFGAVKFDFERARMGSVPERNRRRELCVTRAHMTDSGTWSSPDKFTPPCQGNFRAVPTSTSIYISGNVQLTLTVNPTPSHYGSLVLIDKASNSMAAPPAPSPPPAAKAVVDPQLQSRGIALAKSRDFAEAIRVLEQVPIASRSAEGSTYLGLAYFHQQKYFEAAVRAANAVSGGAGFPDRSTAILSYELQLFGNYLANFPGAEGRALWAYGEAVKVDRAAITADIDAALRTCTGLRRDMPQDYQLRQGIQKACLVFPDRLK